MGGTRCKLEDNIKTNIGEMERGDVKSTGSG